VRATQLELQSSEMEAERSELVQRIRELEAQTAAAAHQIRTADERRSAMADDTKSAQDALTNERAARSAAESEASRLSALLEKAEAAILQSREASRDAQTRVADSESRAREAEARLVEAASRTEKAEGIAANLQARLEKLEREMAEAKTSARAADQATNRAAEERADERIRVLESDVQSARDDLAKAQTEIADVTHRLAESRAEAEQLRAEADRLRADAERLSRSEGVDAPHNGTNGGSADPELRTEVKRLTTELARAIELRQAAEMRFASLTAELVARGATDLTRQPKNGSTRADPDAHRVPGGSNGDGSPAGDEGRSRVAERGRRNDAGAPSHGDETPRGGTTSRPPAPLPSPDRAADAEDTDQEPEEGSEPLTDEASPRSTRAV
jgi:chromosome segregation ATPase